jgi:tetratricopeptide (TPR) repeat protein
MASGLRTLIQSEIQGMEPGRFQDFCLRFLPIFHQRFVGIERHGHTVTGKTRPGVPDLIKTLDSGEQIAVECGTEESYWGPTDDVANLKPYRDIAKCIKTLAKPVEVVAISSREMPRSSVNVKSEIIDALKGQTRAQITLIHVGEISEFLDATFRDPVVGRLIAEFCDTASELIGARRDQQKLQLAQDISQSLRSDSRLLLRVVELAVESNLGGSAARDFVVQEVQASRCLIPRVPLFQGVQRESVEVALFANPGGRAWLVTGLPKIGKSNILLELAPRWNSFDVRFFDIAIDESEAANCAVEISAELLTIFLPTPDIGPLIRSELLRREALSRPTLPGKPVLLVVDNADRLPKQGIRQISEIIEDLKTAGLVAETLLSCIFFSSRSLPTFTCLDRVVSAPVWSAAELRRLLKRELGGIPGPADQTDKYVEWLQNMSGGHPLFSLAVAKKCANLAELMTAPMRGLPTLGGEELSNEVQSFMYDDLLQDSDSQNFVQRLSVLMGKQQERELEVVRSVAPPLTTPVATLLRRLSGSIIEGDPTIGFEVPPIFRDIARGRISVEEMRAVYRDVADSLFQPDGNVLNAERAIGGIIHGILGGEESKQKAMMRTAFLMMLVLKDSLPAAQLKTVLERMSIVAVVLPSPNFGGQFAQTMAQIALAMGFARLQNFDRAAEILGKLHFVAAPSTSEIEFAGAKPLLRRASIVFRALCLADKDAVSALNTLGQLQEEDLADAENETIRAFFDLVGSLLSRSEYTPISARLVRMAVLMVNANEPQHRDAAVRIAAALATRAKTDELAFADIDRVFSGSTLNSVLRSFCKATFLLESGREKESLDEIETALGAASDVGIEVGADLARILLVKGDAALRLEDEALAQEAYTAAFIVAPEQSFEWSWSAWRLGQLKQDYKFFWKSAEGFKYSGFDSMWGRALGACGALLIKLSQKAEGLKLLATLIEGYFAKGLDKAGSAATLAMAHVTRLQSEIEGRELEKKEEFPPFETDGYESVVEDARPRSGGTLAFFNIGETYRALGDLFEAQVWFRKALQLDPVDRDYFSLSMIVERVLADSSLDESDYKWIYRRCAELLLLQERRGAFVSRFFLSWCYFHSSDDKLDRSVRMQQTQAAIDSLQGVLEGASTAEPYWLAEIYLRKGAIARLQSVSGSEDFRRRQEAYAARQFQSALENARTSENGPVLLAAGHALGFELPSFAGSLRQVAEFQYLAVVGLELQNTELSRTFGIARNLYNFWRTIQWSVLRESDLKAKRLLKDSAVEMGKAQVPQEQAESAMLLLLCKLFDREGPCLQYILAERGSPIDKLPEVIRERITE